MRDSPECDSAYDVIVIGGGPAGATLATRLAAAGAHVLLLDRAGRIKPCGGAIPPRLIRDFAIPDHLLKARVRSARAVAPSGRAVTMAVADQAGSGFVGMVDRDEFDEWLRARAAEQGAERRTGRFLRLEQQPDGRVAVLYEPRRGDEAVRVVARLVVGADGARSEVARQALPRQRTRHVFAYHEIVRSPAGATAEFDPTQCDVIYRGALSPDFYAWVFPHGAQTSIGVGSARKGFALRASVERLRRETGLDACATVRGEGAPIPLKPLGRWDNGRNVLVVGDAAGVVAPASGEGIYYAMASAAMGADAVSQALATGDGRALGEARRRFMAEHGKVFRVLGLLQAVWYRNDWLRERFVALCRDPDVQRLTWDAYMNKAMVKAQHKAHLRLFLANCANLIAARFRPAVPVPAEPDLPEPGVPDGGRQPGALGRWRAGALILGTVAVVAVLGRRTSPTDDHPAIRDWYDGLDKPGFTPPDAVFRIAWPLIETGLAVGTYRLLRRRRGAARDTALALQAVNQAGLVGWNELFFGRQAMGQGTILAGALTASAAGFSLVAAREDRIAAWASAPLAAWLSFATLLSWSVWRRNPDRSSDAPA